MKLYLDNCCYNRPFDDQSQERVHLESEAVLIILRRGQRKIDTIIGSAVLDLEMNHMADPVKRAKVKELYITAGIWISYTEEIYRRAQEIRGQSKIQAFDSLHIAAAESAGADFLITTDDRLEKMAGRMALNVRVANPLAYLKEVL